MKAAIFSNHSPRVGFGVDRKMAVSRSQVMVVAASRNHLYRRRLQVVIDAGPRNHLYLLGQQVKIRSSPRNQLSDFPALAIAGVLSPLLPVMAAVCAL